MTTLLETLIKRDDHQFTAEDIIEAFTPKNPEDVDELIKLVLKRYKPRRPREVCNGQDTIPVPYSSEIGEELQDWVFKTNSLAETKLGDDYSVNTAAAFMGNRVLDKITQPQPDQWSEEWTARNLGIAFAHLATTAARTAAIDPAVGSHYL